MGFQARGSKGRKVVMCDANLDKADNGDGAGAVLPPGKTDNGAGAEVVVPPAKQVLTPPVEMVPEDQLRRRNVARCPNCDAWQPRLIKPFCLFCGQSLLLAKCPHCNPFRGAHRHCG